MAPRNRSSLSSQLDREVLQVVKKVKDSFTQFGETSRVSATQIYDEIRRSNSSLNRRPKKLLEDSIERVLDVLRADQDDSKDLDDEEEQDFNAAIEREEELRMKSSGNGLNRTIVGAWAKSSGPQASTASGASTPKRERQANGEALPKRRKTAASMIDKTPPSNIALTDVGGNEEVINQLMDLLMVPMWFPSLLQEADIQPTRGILLHGPPGCGKTMLANAIAARLGVNFISISAPSVVSGMSGESEKALREHFEEARRSAPCLMFIDEIDSITPKRESAQREMEKRIVAQLLTCMDDLDISKTEGKSVIVLAATNRPDSLDPALRRGGRFDKEILMPVPNEKTRESILRALTRKWKLGDDVDFALLAERTPGCVGADLKDLVSTAASLMVKRFLTEVETAAIAHHQQAPMEIDSDSTSPLLTRFDRIEAYRNTHQNDPDHPNLNLHISMPDFLDALPQIQPSALREGFATIPSTTFADIGALQPHISLLHQTLITPILNPTLYTNLGLRLSSGILLWGPPGCGKTLLAKAVANASHANFISVKGPELLNKYVGESERAIRSLFTRARSSIPVIIFFDELDALVPRRDGAGSGSEASARVVNTLLTELDGVGTSREGIYVIGATNRPDLIDSAMRRPGRLETPMYVGLPSREERVDILKTLVRRLPRFEWQDDMEQVAGRCEWFSGADLEALVRQATLAAIRRCAPEVVERRSGGYDRAKVMYETVGKDVRAEDIRVLVADFEVALENVKPSNSAEDIAKMLLLKREMERSQ